MSKKRIYLGAGLRPGLDDDLAEAVQRLDSATKSEIVRTGARWALGMLTQRVVEVREVPLTSPERRG